MRTIFSLLVFTSSIVFSQEAKNIPKTPQPPFDWQTDSANMKADGLATWPVVLPTQNRLTIYYFGNDHRQWTGRPDETIWP